MKQKSAMEKISGKWKAQRISFVGMQTVPLLHWAQQLTGSSHSASLAEQRFSAGARLYIVWVLFFPELYFRWAPSVVGRGGDSLFAGGCVFRSAAADIELGLWFGQGWSHQEWAGQVPPQS